MSYLTHLTERRQALAACRATRTELDGAVSNVLGAYRARPLPILAGAAAIGFVLGHEQVGRSVAQASMRIATGPTWRLVRQFMQV